MGTWPSFPKPCAPLWLLIWTELSYLAKKHDLEPGPRYGPGFFALG